MGNRPTQSLVELLCRKRKHSQ